MLPLSPSSSPALLAGGANPALGRAVAARLGVEPVRCTLERFPDGELHVQIEESVRARDVYLLQPTSPPAEVRLFELLLLADACRRSGAARLTAVIPYFGYARQDRRGRGREAVAARVAAELVRTAGFERIVALDLHTPPLEGFFACPVEHLTAMPVLVASLQEALPEDGVVVSPDLGAAKLAEQYATSLGLPVAIVHKVRLSGENVEARRLSGEVRGRRPIIVDDMLTTAGTVEAAARAMLEAGCRPEITVAATHGVFAGSAEKRLGALPIERILVTDTLAVPSMSLRNVEIVSVSGLLADTIDRLASGRSVADLTAHR
jgi:ribose-phosphate pyrophosphokinase